MLLCVVRGDEMQAMLNHLFVLKYCYSVNLQSSLFCNYVSLVINVLCGYRLGNIVTPQCSGYLCMYWLRGGF